MEYYVTRRSDDDELMRYGVPGMKWGVRRYQNKDGSLTDAGIKKYAKAGYAQDSYNSNKTKLGKIYDKYTGAHKLTGDMMYGLNSKEQNRSRAEKYVADKQAAKKNRSSTIKANKAEKKLNKQSVRMKEAIKRNASGEMAKRGKAAMDVLKNGDSDWMGHPIRSDDTSTELKNRGKAALERLMYSEDQIDNKKFFGRYDF